MRERLRRSARLNISAFGAIITLAVPIVFWWRASTCPTPTLLLLYVFAVGLLGVAFVSFLIRSPKPAATRWLPWILSGALLGSSLVGIGSVAPWTLLAAIFFGVAGIANALRWGAAGEGVGAVLAAALVSFAALFFFAKDAGIEVVPIPQGSLGESAFEHIDYADAYRVRLPGARHYDFESATEALKYSWYPCWTRPFLALPTADKVDIAPGDRVFAEGPGEILIGSDDDHLNYRVSVLLGADSASQWLTLSTFVEYNNWVGAAYFIPVRIGHRVLMPQVGRNLAGILAAQAGGVGRPH